MMWKNLESEESSVYSESDYTLTYDPFDSFIDINKNSVQIMRNKEYTQDQADRRLDSFARIIHAVIEKVLKYKSDKLKKYLDNKDKLINRIETLKKTKAALNKEKQAKIDQLVLKPQYLKDQKT